MVGGWGNRNHRPLGCKQDKRPAGILMTPSVAFVGEGEVYLREEPILLRLVENSEGQLLTRAKTLSRRKSKN